MLSKIIWIRADRREVFEEKIDLNFNQIIRVIQSYIGGDDCIGLVQEFDKSIMYSSCNSLFTCNYGFSINGNCYFGNAVIIFDDDSLVDMNIIWLDKFELNVLREQAGIDPLD